MRRVVTCNKKAKLLGQFSNWSIPTTRPRVCPVSDTIQRQSQGVVACASESSPPSSQSDSSLLKTEAQITSTWSDHVDLQSESVSNPRRQGSSFLLEFAVGCLVAALLPATSYWLFLRRQNIRPECQPPVTSVSIVYRPSSEKPSHLPFSQETEQITIQQRSKQHDSSHTDLEVAPYQRNPSLLSGTGAFRASLAREFTEDHASGLLATEQEVWQLERVASGLQTGPSGRDASPSRNFEGSHESPNAQVSANTDARISFNSSQRLVDTFRTRLVWDSGAVEPAGMTMTSASHQLPFVNPPVSTDPFASRAVWDTGREPAQAASSISAPETPPPADSPWSSAVRLCSHNRRGSPFRLVLRFPTKGNSFVRDVAKRVGPSVVRINTERSQPTEAGGKDLFSKFFGGEDLALEERTKDREQGQGSGFVVDGRKGIIVTNAHVINRADTVLVSHFEVLDLARK